MASISQTIPNYVSGISEQPDELKTPGQVTVAKNVLPDVTQGLIKRPGGKLIGSALSAYTTDSKWFHYYRDEDEQYIGQIQLSSGEIKMWRCDTGAAVTVSYESGQETALKNYLKQTNSGGTITDSDIQSLTLNDYTYLTNRNKTAAMAATVETVRPPEAFIELNKVAYASQYSLNLFDNTDLTTTSTVTRLDIETVIDSKNCGRAGEQSSGDDTKGKGPVKGVLCGSKMSNNLYDQFTVHTGVMQWDNVTSHITPMDDANCPNVGTEIFNINAGEAWKKPLQNSNGVGGITLVNRGGTNYVNGEVHTGALFNVSDSTTYTLVIDPSGINDTLTCTTDGDATFDELITGLQADADYDTTKYTIQRAGHYYEDVTNYDPSEGRIQVIFKEHTGTKSASTLGGVALSRTTTYYAPLESAYLPASESFTISDSIKPKNLYFRVSVTGQSVSPGTSTTPKYQCRYTTVIDLLHGGENWEVGDYFHIWLHNAKYKITVSEVSTTKVQANLGLLRPTPTSFDTKTTVTAESIIGTIRSAIIDTGNFTDANVQHIGSGIYVTRPSGTFNVSTPVGELLNVLTGSIKDVADLPNQCKHGYVVRIANSEAEEDDYYVKFIGENDRDGEGIWEECAKPGVKTTLDPATMPVQLVRQANGTFKVSQIDWDVRQVGDTVTVEEPSFIDKTINKMLFFRNRLVILSDENVIMSRPGDFYNFWPKSAITYTATDHIDLSCSSEYPAIVYDGIQVNSGLVLFTKNQQFMLTTDSDVLSPLTAKINALASYNFNFNTNPVSLGTTIAFLDNAGKYNRFWEMQAVLREGEPNVIEQSKSISKSFDSLLDMVANSRENQVIFFGKKGTNTLYGFRYHTTSSQRIQQAWFNWEVKGLIQYIAMLDDALFIIAKDGSTYTMQRLSIRGLSDSLDIIDDQGNNDATDDIRYRVHLDNSVQVLAGAISYSSTTGKSTFTKPSGFDTSNTNLVVISYDSDGDNSGRYSTATINGSNVEIDGDWSSENIVLGYNYDMEVQIPTIYVQQQVNEQFKSQIHSSLVVHRVKFSLGPSGLYTTTLSRPGKTDYVQTHESPLAELYNPNRIAVNNIQKETIPVYEKNTNLTLTLKSTHPTPATLYSMTWEGDYSNKFYKSV